MATIKSYTDIEQSKKLAKILPLESADMYYAHDSVFDELESIPTITEEDDHFELFPNDVGCWSLAALLKTLNFPSLTQNKEDEWEICVFDHDNDDYIRKRASNPVDACYEMIMRLHELKML